MIIRNSVHGLTYQSLLPQPSVHVGQFGMIEMGWLTERGRLLAATEWTWSIVRRYSSLNDEMAIA